MKEDPYVFLNRIANNCKAIEAEQAKDHPYDIDEQIKQQKIHDRFGECDLDYDWSFGVQDDAPERKDWHTPELI